MCRKYIKFFAALFAAVAMVGCFDDESTLDINKADLIEIDPDAKIPSLIRLKVADMHLNITPDVKIGETLNPEGLKYTWEMTSEPIDFVNNGNVSVISNEKTLDVDLDLEPSTGTYKLYLTVTDPVSNNSWQKSWKIQVAGIPSGVLIAHTKDESTSEISLLAGHSYSSLYEDDEPSVVYHDLYASWTGAPLNALVKRMDHLLQGQRASGMHTLIIVTNEDKIKMFNMLDGSTNYYITSKFWNNETQKDENVTIEFDLDAETTMKNQPGVAKYQTMRSFTDGNNSFAYGVADNKLSFANFSSLGLAYTAPTATIANVENYIEPEGISISLGGHQEFYSVRPHFVGYMPRAGKFIGADGTYSAPTDITGTTGVAFDPVNYQNRTAIFADMGFNGITHIFLMKNNETNNYEICQIQCRHDSDPIVVRDVAVIPAELNAKLDKAVSYSTSLNEPVLYVASGNEVIAINFVAPSNVMHKVVYTAPAGENISAIKQFIQPNYRRYVSSFENYYKLSDLNAKALMVATYKGGEGKLHVIPQVIDGMGTLNESNAQTFEGFGRIQCFCLMPEGAN